MNKPTRRNLVLGMICSVFIITMCRCYDNTVGFVSYQNGLTCQFFTDYSLNSGLSSDEGHQCTYVCPNGYLVTMDLPIEKLSISQSELDGEICSGAGPVATNTAVTSAATATLSTIQGTVTLLPTLVSPSPTGILPLLSHEVTSCGTAGASRIIWINFRLAEPRLDLTGRSLSVTVGAQPTNCGINRDNTSLLTCFLPGNVTYPASVMVSVDGVAVNNFTISVNNGVCRPRAASTSVPAAAPTSALPSSAIPPTSVPPTSISPTSIPPTAIPPTPIPPSPIPPTAIPTTGSGKP